MENYFESMSKKVAFLVVEGFDQENRVKLALKYSKICSLIVKQQINVVIGVIGLFNEVHQWNRRNIPGYIEVFSN